MGLLPLELAGEDDYFRSAWPGGETMKDQGLLYCSILGGLGRRPGVSIWQIREGLANWIAEYRLYG